METLNDEDLMLAFVEGEEKAFEELYIRYYQKVLNFLCRLLKDINLCEDLSNETFIRIMKYKNSYKKGKIFKNWLFSIAMNVYRDVMKSRYHNEFSSEDDNLEYYHNLHFTDNNVEDMVIQKEKIYAIKEAIETLPEHLKIIVVLRYDQELSFNDIKEILKKPERTIKWRLNKALKMLREELKKRGITFED